MTEKTLCITDTCNDPQWNLAAEEYLLKSFSKPVFRLWRNSKAIIIGQNQNAMAEINSDWVKSHGIPVVRRLSGGGAVFHDLGNINFTFIETKRPGEDTSEMFRRFTLPIIKALDKLGIKACLEGRNDLVIDGRKFSGNAIAVHRDRLLQHGCILFDASMESLAQALKSRPEKFKGKAVSSNRSRVTNISEHLKSPMTPQEFISFLRQVVESDYGSEMTTYEYTQQDIREIDALAEGKYRLDSWNFGKSPDYSVGGVDKFPGGLLEAYARVSNGTITSVSIMGDYFFEKPTSEIEQMLTGLPYSKEAVIDRLQQVDFSRYFSNITVSDLISILF